MPSLTNERSSRGNWYTLRIRQHTKSNTSQIPSCWSQRNQFTPHQSAAMRDLYPPPDVVPYARTSRNAAPPLAASTSVYPPPDISSPSSQTHPQNHRSQRVDPTPSPRPRSSAAPPAPSPPRADFLIIGLFALRLTQRMLVSLPDFAHRAADLGWLGDFLSPYDPAYDLAKISGSMKEDFLDNYPKIVSTMKRQDGFPVRFMALNPLVRESGGRNVMSDGT